MFALNGQAFTDRSNIRHREHKMRDMRAIVRFNEFSKRTLGSSDTKTCNEVNDLHHTALEPLTRLSGALVERLGDGASLSLAGIEVSQIA